VPQKIKENLDKIKKENKNSNTPYNSERKRVEKCENIVKRTKRQPSKGWRFFILNFHTKSL
jgi:hypothetical protein